MADATGDAVSEQVSQMAVDGRVRFLQDERQLHRVDERHPAEGVEQLSVGKGHSPSVTIERPGGQPSRDSHPRRSAFGPLTTSHRLGLVEARSALFWPKPQKA